MKLSDYQRAVKEFQRDAATPTDIAQQLRGLLTGCENVDKIRRPMTTDEHVLRKRVTALLGRLFRVYCQMCDGEVDDRLAYREHAIVYYNIDEFIGNVVASIVTKTRVEFSSRLAIRYNLVTACMYFSIDPVDCLIMDLREMVK